MSVEASIQTLIQRRGSLIMLESTNSKNKEGISQCFQKVLSKLYVSLAPMYISDPINGIKVQHLDNLIMTYYSPLQGVVISYKIIGFSDEKDSIENQEDSTTLITINESSPFSFLWLTVEFLVWKPQVSDVLEGQVYMQTASHIGLLVHETFNASIKKFSIPQEWTFVPVQPDEYSADSGNRNNVKSFGYWQDEMGAKVEGKIRFTVRAIHYTGKMVSLEGTLIKPGTELEIQPVTRSRRSSNTNTQSKHKKFDEEAFSAVAEVNEPNEKGVDTLPSHSKSSDSETEFAVASDSD